MSEQDLKQLLASAPMALFRFEWRDDAPAPDSFHGLDLPPGFFVPVFVSDYIRKITGDDPEDCLSPEWFPSRVNPADWPVIVACFRKMMEQGSSTTSYRFRCADGREIWLEHHARLIRDESGNPSELIGSWRDVSESKRLAEKSREEARRNALILESTMDGVIIADDQGRIIHVNPAYCRMVGYSAQELTAMNIVDLEAALSPAEVADKIRQMVTDGQAHFETRHRRKDGDIIDLDVSIFVMPHSGGGMLVTAFVHDITESKRRERQLSALVDAARRIGRHLSQDEIRRELVASARILLDCRAGAVGFVVDGVMRFRNYWCDDQEIEIEIDFPPGMGVPGHVMATKKPYLTNDARNDPHVILEIQKRFGFKKLINIPILGRGGEIFGCFEMHDPISGRNFVERDVEMLESLAAVVADALENARLVHNLRQSHQHLSATNRMLRMISDCNQALIRVRDEQELLETICSLLVNEGGYMMAWVGEAVRDEARSIKPLSCVGAEDGYLESVRISWADDEYGQGPSGRAVRTGRPVVCQDILHDPMFAPWRKEAVRRGYASSVALPLMVDGKAVGVLTIYAGSPHAFHAEELALLEELASDLSFGIEVLRHRKEKEALEQRFIQAQKMEAVGTLAGGIAHDFNNVLAAILGTAYLARQKASDLPDVAEKLKTIEDTGFRAAEMIKKMLTFARKVEVHRQPMLLEPFVKETFKLVRSSVPEDVNLVLDVEMDDQAMVDADATLLQQVLLNLVQNARHAVAGAARPEIRVVLRGETPDGAWLIGNGLDDSVARWAHLTVIDNGCGIPAKVREHIFEPFFTTKKAGEGTGLGLSMSLGAVQSHGGMIEVESEEGQGSSFHVWLPLLPGESVEWKSRGEGAIQGRGELVLLADDEPEVREVTREVLESLGYRVLTAGDGERALELFGEHRDEVRIAVLDVVMPIMGGVQALKRMRDERPDLPVVFQTGYGEDLVREGIGELERGVVMTKPVDVPSFSRALRRMLDEEE